MLQDCFLDIMGLLEVLKKRHRNINMKVKI